MCNKDILNNSRQILYTRPYALLTFIHKGLPHMPINYKGPTSNKEITNKNKFELQTAIKA